MSAEQRNPPGWTGERYILEIGGNIRLEQVPRYMIARELSAHKRVLDIAPGVVAGAASRNKRPNLEFRQGACEAHPCTR